MESIDILNRLKQLEQEYSQKLQDVRTQIAEYEFFNQMTNQMTKDGIAPSLRKLPADYFDHLSQEVAFEKMSLKLSLYTNTKNPEKMDFKVVQGDAYRSQWYETLELSDLEYINDVLEGQSVRKLINLGCHLEFADSSQWETCSFEDPWYTTGTIDIYVYYLVKTQFPTLDRDQYFQENENMTEEDYQADLKEHNEYIQSQKYHIILNGELHEINFDQAVCYLDQNKKKNNNGRYLVYGITEP